MSWYHAISPRRINDPRVRGCKPLARVVWGVLVAGDLATKVPGLARGGRLTIAEVLEVDVDDAAEALAELVAVGVVEVDPRERLIRLRGVAEDYRRLGGSIKTATHWLRRCWDLPPCPLLGRHAAELRGVSTERVADDWDALIAACGGAQPALAGPSPAPERQSLPSPGKTPAKPKEAKRGKRKASPARLALRRRLESAQAILVAGRASLGFDDTPEPVNEAVLRLAENTPPEILERLEVMVRRAIERRRREWERGDDYRRYLTLSAILRMSEQFFNATDLDGPPAAPRGPPAGAGFMQGPTDF